MMMLILIKYLEERKDENGNGALNPAIFYKEFNEENSTLTGVLKDADTFASVLSKLSSKEHFNGQIFSLNEEEIKNLRQIDLTIFENFVEGNVSFFTTSKHGVGQMSLWRLYQFNYLPIELISHIYEDFLANEDGLKKKGVVYTPPYLVQFLIDRSMPLNVPKADFKVLDPACGSGIFLVGAFKRMIQWWRLENSWAKPRKENIEALKGILLKNIFGCDLEEEAVTLTYFSLGLALLDALSPKEIWNNVHFDNLIGQNLISGDFFKTLHEGALPLNFGLVIGNPPFNSEFTEWAELIDKSVKSFDRERPDVPDNQIALLFLEQSFKLLIDGGSCCLLLPSGPVLYNTHQFRNHLFLNNYYKEIYDFTALRAKLFIGSSSNAKPSVVAVFAEKSDPVGRPTHHIIFRRTRASGEKIEFETDHYDIHNVSNKTAINSPGIWQANFMGGGRLSKIIEKIIDKGTLGDFLRNKEIENQWYYGEGWQECPNSAPLKRINELLENKNKTTEEKVELDELDVKHKADWITGKQIMNTDGSISICEKEYFQWPRKKTLFEPPHLLVHENVRNGKSQSCLVIAI